ncbi:MAG: hypothetical protein KME29_07595 [Calothrix sp. FI2-JRJ7]|nr:hypothetical protein [Calothrix sp. FI2-JRJ7]
MTARISDEIGGLPTLTGRQQRRFDRAVTLAVRRILRGSTDRLDPLNTTNIIKKVSSLVNRTFLFCDGAHFLCFCGANFLLLSSD